jgi:hypothetical protein
MNQPQYISLMDALTAVPDPRKAHGKRHSPPVGEGQG